jgi:ubiquinone/menaquinone biosynthesis C-methylase UbiE
MQLKDTGERVIEDANSQDSPNYLRHMAAYNFAAQCVKDKVVLDSGSGSGYGAYYLIKNGARRVVGVDISEEATEYAKEKYKFENLGFESGNVTQLRFPDETFDVVTSFQVIEHLKDTNEFLEEIRRVLKKSGVALISTPNKKTYSPNTPNPENPFHQREFYLSEFREILKSHFARVDILGMSYSPCAKELTKKLEQTERFLRQSRFLNAVRQVIPKRIRRLLSPMRGRRIGPSDFIVSGANLESCLDFIAVCKKT